MLRVGGAGDHSDWECSLGRYLLGCVGVQIAEVGLRSTTIRNRPSWSINFGGIFGGMD